MTQNFFRFLLALFCIHACCQTRAADDQWRSIRGNDGLGKWSGTTKLSRTKNPGFKLRWKKKIGSGYSSVVVADGKVITMATDGKQDFVICLDQKDGSPIWDFPMEPIFKGSNGSFDGPISTPVIQGNTVFCLSARGKLFAFDLQSGSKKWQRDFVKEEKATQPLYGFSTTPVISGNTLCVLAGAEKGSLVGLDLATGTTKWHAASGAVASQIPLVTQLAGQELVIAPIGRSVFGVKPATGKVVFEFKHNGSNGSAMMPVPFDQNKLLLTNDDSFSKAFKIEPADNGFNTSEFWSDRSIKNTYNVPVAHNGRLFAYSTRILTCVDQKTGKPLWKSRKPGDGFLISVDNHLVIVTKKGSVHLAKLNAEKYEELARTKVFENLVWAIPAYANNAIFVRSLGEIACVEFVDANESIVAGNRSTRPLGRNFAAFLAKAESVANPSPIIDAFLDQQSSFPIIEDGIAHFVFRGPAKDVALACDVFGARQEEKMIRLKGSDLFYFSMKLPADQRVSYIFLKDFQPIKDPLNKRTMTSSMYAGEMEFAIRLRNEKPLEMSWFGMQEWRTPQWMQRHRRTRLAGKIVEEKIEFGDKQVFAADVYLPPEYSKDTTKTFPTIYVHDGASALRLGELDEVADLYFQANPQHQAILVFLKTSPTRSALVYLDNVASKVVPFVDNKYRTQADRKSRASLGAGFGSSSAIGLVAKHSDLFGACSVQSPLVFDQARAMAIEGFQKIKSPTNLYLEWGRFDMHNPVENWDIRKMARTMHDEIKSNSAVNLSGGMVNDSTDWGSWKFRFDRIVTELFAKK